MGEKAPQRRQDDGGLSVLPILTERKGPTFSISVGLATSGKLFTAGFEIVWKISLSSRWARIPLPSMRCCSAASGLISAAPNKGARCQPTNEDHVLPLWPPGLCVSRGSRDPPQHIRRCRRARYSPALDAMRPQRHLREYLSPQGQLPRQRIA